MNLNFDTTLRTLMLPADLGLQNDYTNRAEKILKRLKVDEDFNDWVRIELEIWKSSGKPSKDFKVFISQFLFSEDLVPKSILIRDNSEGLNELNSSFIKAFADKYFSIHEKIMLQEKINHEEARRILSNASLILSLAFNNNMTASRIFSFLNQQQINVGSSWSTVRLILDQCEIRQKISEQEVERIFNSDMAAEELLLEDFSIPNAIDYISEVCEKFGFDPDLSKHLKTLMITDFHAPYLCMLHFQLIISEVFNHKMINAYEFKPRGESVLWLSARTRMPTRCWP